MAITVSLFYPHFQQHTGGRDEVEVRGDNIGECLANLVNQYPGLKENLFNDQGRPYDYIAIYVNGESTYHQPQPLLIPTHDGDKLSIALLLAGG